MRNYLYSLLTLALACVASSAWAGSSIPDYIYQTYFWEGDPANAMEYQFTPDFEVDGLYYKIIDGGVELTRGAGNISDAPEYTEIPSVLPASVTFEGKTYPVIRIGDCAFHKNTSITDIVIPEGVKSIGEAAFYNATKLTDVRLSSTIESIGENAFALSALCTINLTKSVNTIGNNSFAGCKNLSSITLNSQCTDVGENALGSKVWNMVYNYYFYIHYDYIWYTPLKDLYCLASVPPTVDETLFAEIRYGMKDEKSIKPMYEVTTLHVPAESVELYKQTAPWNHFKAIYGDGESSLSETMAEAEGIRVEGGRIVGEGVMDVYDLGGRQVARGTADQLPTLPAGFYVVRNSHSTAKVLVP